MSIQLSDREKLFGEAATEEEEEGLGVKKKERNFLANLPILGYMISVLISWSRGKWRDILRRRRSYKLSLFFQFQMLFCLSVFLAFFIVSMQDMSLLRDPSRVAADCALPSSVAGVPLFSPSGQLLVDGVYNATIESRSVLSCSNENSDQLDAACDLDQFQALVTLMLVTGIFFLIAMIITCLVFSGFNFFSNIPMEALDVGTTSWKVSFLSSMCRFGPWLVRGTTLLNLVLVLVLVLLSTVSNYCLGSVAKTHACVNMYDDCVKLQFENCRYYYSDNCMGEGLPHSVSQNDNFKQCKDSSFAAKFSGRFDARLVYPTPCSRCWALHSDCRDPETNRFRFTENVTSTEFVYTNSSTLSPALWDPFVGREILCRCVEGLDAGTEEALLFDPIKLTNNNTNCESFVNATTTCPASLTTGLGAPLVDTNATYWSPDWTDAVLNQSVAQECSWAPSDAAYFYDTNECAQEGSTLNRFAFILGYITILLMAIFIVAGLAVRYTVQSETWSYSPRPPNEPWYWKVLRLLGPG